LRPAVDDVVGVGVGVSVVLVFLVSRSVFNPAPAPASNPASASSSTDLLNADGDDKGTGASGRSDSSRIMHVTGARTPWMRYLQGGSLSNHRRAVAEEEGEREGGCSGSAVGINHASSHVSSSREGGRGQGGGGLTSSDASGWVRAVTSKIKIRLTLDNSD
jgi:hypothetical protein